MNFSDLLSEALRTLPTISSDTHWIKFALSLKRFAARYPSWTNEDFLVLIDRSQLNTLPKATGLFHTHVINKVPRYTPTGAPRLISRGVFPLVYVAAHHWHEDAGFPDMVNAYRERALHEGTYLGHGWSVWCSFFEVLEELKNPEDVAYAVERFAEFASFSFKGYPSSNSKWTPPKQDDPGEIAFGHVLDAALERPGFFGHHILTLGYLVRHRDSLSDVEWRVGLATVLRMTETTYDDDEDNVLIHYNFSRNDSEDTEWALSDTELEQTLRRLMFHGPKDVHSITLADVAYELYEVADELERKKLLFFLNTLVR